MSNPSELTKKALDLFAEALEVPAGDRSRWLAGRTEGEPELRREVSRLLAAHERQGVLEGAPEVPEVEDLAGHLSRALGDRYRIQGELGRGGMAVVFLAWEKKHDRRVVLKVLKPEVAVLYGAERFKREVRLAGQLSHPHILGLIDSGEADGLLYYVMPHVEGETLRQRLRARAPLPMEEAVALLRDIASALDHAHEAGVIHRDLKPDNVLCAGSHAYLLDFGVAKSLGSEADPELTRTGLAVGTPRYMAPEQAGGSGEVDHRADIYAWGQLAHEMLTGRVRGRSSREADGPGVYKEVVRELGRERPDVPRSLAETVGRCLESWPDARMETAREILGELGDIRFGVGGRTGPGSRSRIRGWALGAVAVVLLITAFVVGSRPTTSPEAAASLLPTPVAVAAFTNETGDSSLTALGRLAGDWLTQGLQQTGLVPVVPWPTALEATERAWARGAAEGTHVDLVSFLARETGAQGVITGSFYRVGDELRFRAEVADAREGRVLSAPEPVAVPLDSGELAVRTLRDRLMGSLAVFSDERAATIPGLARRPPTFEAYRAFDRGVELYLAQEYGEATPQFLRAFELDTMFTVSLVYAAYAAANEGDVERVDSLIEFLRPRRERLDEFQDQRLEYLDALAHTDAERALVAARRAAELGPHTRAVYNLALTALSTNRPREALAALRSLDPDAPGVRGWAQYWTQLAHALHVLGRYREELEAAREMRARYPERRLGLVLEARALAVLDRLADLDRILQEASALPPDTYWSQGAAMVVAGEELLAHGRPQVAELYLEGALEWLDTQLALDPSNHRFRYWRASALYDLRRFSEAGEIFEGLAADFPGSGTYRGMAALCAAWEGNRQEALDWLAEGFEHAQGDQMAYRGRVEAVLGGGERAIPFLSEAFRRGVNSGWAWIHASGHHDLSLLADNPRFRRLRAGPEASLDR